METLYFNIASEPSINYVYIEPYENGTYRVYCKCHHNHGIKSVPKEFIHAMLDDAQLKKLNKGIKRFNIEWSLYFKVIIFALDRYWLLENRSLDLLKYYVNHHTIDGQVIRTKEPYITYEEFEKAYEGRLDDKGLFKYAAKIGYEYFSDYYWSEKWYFTKDECKFFQKKILNLLPQMRALQYAKLSLTKDCELIIESGD